MLAHVGGVPFEEWLFPLAATGGGLAFALRAMVLRAHRRSGGRRRGHAYCAIARWVFDSRRPIQRGGVESVAYGLRAAARRDLSARTALRV